MLDKVWLLPALMAGAFVVTLFFGKRLPKKGAEVGTAAVALCLVLASVAAVQWIQRPAVAHHETEMSHDMGTDAAATEGEGEALGSGGSTVRIASVASGVSLEGEAAEEPAALREPIDKSVSWYKDGNLDIRLGIHVDGFAVAMLFVVAFISLCVHIFSIEYLRDDKRFTHYFAALNLFTGAMLWMVQTSSTLGLLFGWELMGLCSFLLIGHWWEEKNNTDAALKAFLTTRTGDIGLLIGIVMLFFISGRSFDMAHINEMALNGKIDHRLLLIAACCLFAGVIGKSAQFPLHTWLPDAMAGPTPATTMVAA
jgi:NADH-quinone oxidoreductase subunit L